MAHVLGSDGRTPRRGEYRRMDSKLVRVWLPHVTRAGLSDKLMSLLLSTGSSGSHSTMR